MRGSVTQFGHSILQIEANMSQQPIPLETLTTISQLTTQVKPFGLRILKTSGARTLFLAIVPFGTLLSSGCANRDLASTSGHVGKAFMEAPMDRQEDTYGTGFAAESGAFVDWSKPARNQVGPQAPEFGGRAEP
jgi:hypothetical protein